MSSGLSPNAFLQKLTDDLEQIAKDEGLDLSNHENAELAFAYWVADLFMHGDIGLEDELDDVVQRGGRDLGIDVVLRDDSNKTLVLIQSKYRGYGKKQSRLRLMPQERFSTVTLFCST